jgi:hypothetical protein
MKQLLFHRYSISKILNNKGLTIMYSSVLDPLMMRRVLTESLVAKSSMELTIGLKMGMDSNEV